MVLLARRSTTSPTGWRGRTSPCLTSFGHGRSRRFPALGGCHVARDGRSFCALPLSLMEHPCPASERLRSSHPVRQGRREDCSIAVRQPPSPPHGPPAIGGGGTSTRRARFRERVGPDRAGRTLRPRKHVPRYAPPCRPRAGTSASSSAVSGEKVFRTWKACRRTIRPDSPVSFISASPDPLPCPAVGGEQGGEVRGLCRVLDTPAQDRLRGDPGN